jgi:hypothetical protein
MGTSVSQVRGAMGESAALRICMFVKVQKMVFTPPVQCGAHQHAAVP